MSVEKTNTRQAYQNELSELQTEYQQKKKKLVQDNEQQLDDLNQNYGKRKEKVFEQNEAAINHIQSRQTEEMDRLQERRKNALGRSAEQLQKSQNKYQEKIEQVQSTAQERLAKYKEAADKKVKAVSQDSEKRVHDITEKSQQNMTQTKEKYQKTIRETEEKGQARLADVTEKSEKQVQGEIQKGQEKKQIVFEQNQKDLAKQDKLYKSAIEEQKTVGEKKIQRLNTDSEKQYAHKQEQWSDRKERLDKDFTNKLSFEKEKHGEQLHTQKKRFDSTYTNNEAANKRALQIQSSNYAKELIELKKKFYTQTEKYSGKEDDPFYKVQDRGSSMKDTANFYVIEAYVPEHEKDQVQVIVHQDKALVTGQRKFVDKTEDENKKISTNTYQSFKEEFSFEQPVITEGIARVRDGDYMVVTIPKLNSFSLWKKA